MTVTDRIQVRIDHDTKALAEKKLRAQGLTLSEYIRMMVSRVAYKDLTVTLEEPNKELESSIQETVNILADKKNLKGYSTVDTLEKDLME